MYRQRKWISLVVTALLFLCCFGAAGSASANAQINEGLEVKAFGFYNAAGARESALTAGEEIVVKATLQSMDAQQKEAALVAALYQNNALVDAALQSELYSVSGVRHDYRLSLTAPENAEECTLTVFLWDGLSTLKPICSGANFSDSNANISKLYINGMEIADFNQEGCTMLPASASGKLKISAVPERFGTEVSVANNHDNTYTLTATAPNGTQKVSTLGITLPEMTNIKTSFSNTKDYSLQTLDGALHNPKFKFADDGVTKLPFGTEFKDRVSLLTADRFHYAWSIPDELEGCRVVGYNYSESPQMRGSVTRFDTTFTVNKSVRVYFSCDWSFCSSAGYSNTANLKNWTNPTVAVFNNGTLADAEKRTDLYNSLEANWNAPNRYLDCIVPAGEASKTFSIIQSSSAAATPCLYYKFIDSEEALQISNISLKNLETEEVSNISTDNYRYSWSKVTSPVYRYNESGELKGFGTSDEVKAAEPPIITRFDSDRWTYIKSFPAEMEGATNIQLPNSLRSNSGKAAEFELTLTINKDSVIYFWTDEEHAAQYGAEKMDEGVYVIETNGFNSVPNPAAAGSQAHATAPYKMELLVPQGQQSASFTIVLTNSQYYGPTIFIK